MTFFPRPLKLVALTVAMVLLCCGWSGWVQVPGAAAQQARHYSELTFPPLPEIKVPPYSRYALPNGLVVYLMEDHELPLVSGTALFRVGDRWEPADQVGLASVMGDTMRDGGTRQHPPDALNQLLEQKAASVETSVSTNAGSASFRALSQDVEQVLGLFAEVIQAPAFAPEQIALAKLQLRGSIERRNDDPDDIASREFDKLIYGASSPYARTVEYATVDRISRDAVVQFYQQYVRPDQMILGIVGDFDPKAMRSLIEQQFGAWQVTSPPPSYALPPVSQAHKGGVFLVDQPQLTQSNIAIGHLGGLFNSPDMAALDVLNGVFNGYGGRLFNEVRSRQGLAYNVYAYWSANFDFPGQFIAGGQTRSEATVPFVKAVFAEIDKLRRAPVTPRELAYAKDSTLNSFIFNFQTPGQTLSRLMRYEYFGYPADFLFRYQKGVKATTIADVQRVARQYLRPQDLVTLVVGNQKAIQPPLTSLQPGTPVTAIDITIPPPKSSVTSKP